MEVWMILMLLACTGAVKSSGTTDSPKDTPAESNNTCNGPSVPPLCPCNLHLDWSAITTDKDGNSVNPSGFDYLRVEIYDLTPESLATGLCAGGVESSRLEFQDLVLLSRTSMDMDVTAWSGRVLGFVPLLEGHSFNTEWYFVDPSSTATDVVLDGNSG
jgi:hypothetical protein